MGRQEKLKVNRPGDALEREADRSADEVLHARSVPSTANPRMAIGSPASPLPFLHGDGHPLPPEERAFFEPRLGWDLSTVRIHTDERAAAAAWGVGARAFTARGNIVFGKGEFAPGTAGGRWLLAHELTHVMQQSGGLLRQVDGGGGEDTLPPESEPVEETITGEQVIDQVVGAQVSDSPVATAGAPATRQVSPASPATVQRVCERPRAQVGYPVRVDLGIPPTPAPDRSLTTAQISAIAGDPSNRTAGYTRFRVRWRWNADIESAGGRSWVTRLTIGFDRASIRIHVTRDFAPGSCELADITRHERQHDRDYRENVAEAERHVCDTAASWPAAGSYPAPVTRDQLTGLIEDWMTFERWQLTYDNWLDGCTWDTVDYPRLYQRCGGAAVAPEADCGDAPVRPEPAHVIPLPQRQP